MRILGGYLTSVVALLAVGVSAPALGSAQNGTVIAYSIPTNGSSAINVAGTRSAKPACATDDAWSLPETSPNKEAIITAKSTGKAIGVYGTGGCDPSQSTRELIAWVTVGI